MQDSIDESASSCADPSKSTEPTIETKEVAVDPSTGTAVPEPTFSAPMENKKHSDSDSCRRIVPCKSTIATYSNEAEARANCISRPECTVITHSGQVGSTGGFVYNNMYYLHTGGLSDCKKNANDPVCKNWRTWTVTHHTAPVAKKYIKTTIVGCNEKSTCAAETNDKASIFDSKINCIITKQDTIKSEKSIIVEQEECITKANSKWKRKTLVESSSRI